MTKATHSFWWKCKKNACHQEVFDTAEEIEQVQAVLRDAWEEYARLYSNRIEMGITWSNEQPRDEYDTLVTKNVVKSAIDTAKSIIAKNRVKVRVLTNGAEWYDKRKAQKLEHYLYGEMKARGAWDIAPQVFTDACVFGTGAFKVFTDDGKVCLERTLISEIIVDERTCPRGNPREMFQRKLVDKHVLLEMFDKKFHAAIEAAACSRDTYADREVPDEMVVVVEAWRLNKRHVICIDGATLLDEDYSSDKFPFVFYRWGGPPLTGFYGLGAARDLHGIQIRIHQLNAFIKECQDLIAVPRIFCEAGSQLNPMQLDNEIGKAWTYHGQPPTFYTPQALNAEIYQYVESLEQAALKYMGISELSAQSLKPAGLESAVALREFNDIETSRFAIQAQMYETMFLELGKRMIQCAKKVYNKKTKVKFTDRQVIHSIEWGDIDMEADRFDLDIQPASLLSMSPSARLQAVTELAQVGAIQGPEIQRLLNHPDLQSHADRTTADIKRIEQVEALLLDGEFEAPEPFDNHDLMLPRLQYLILHAKVEGAPEDILENIRTYIAQVEAMKRAAVEENMPPQPGMPEEGLPMVAGMGPGGPVGPDGMAVSNEVMPESMPALNPVPTV